MAYINVVEWTPDQVTDWIRGNKNLHLLTGQGKVQYLAAAIATTVTTVITVTTVTAATQQAATTTTSMAAAAFLSHLTFVLYIIIYLTLFFSPPTL